ncbi:MAG: phospholipase D-like domain-containing protein [Promethearchaeota archaeon]
MIEPRIVKKLIKTPNIEFKWLWVERTSIKSEDKLSSKFGKYIIISNGDKVLYEKIINMIDNAKEIICISSFIFTDLDIANHLVKASNKGVRIYILTASDSKIRNLPNEESDFGKDVFEKNKKFFDSISNKVKIRTSDKFHAKFILIDPKLQNKKGLFLTSNFTRKSFLENLEIGVILNSEEIDDLFFHFCNGFWLESQYDYIDHEFLPIESPPNAYKRKPINKILVTDSSKYSIKESILKLLESRCKKINLTTFTIKEDNQIVEKLLEHLNKGVEVNILTRLNKKNNMPTLIKLLKAGANIYGDNRIHAKTLIVERDGLTEGIVMTSNFEKLGLDKGFEIGLLLKNDKIKDLKNLIDAWFKQAPYIFKINAILEDLNGEIILWDQEKEKFRSYNIKECNRIKLDDKKSNQVEEFINYEIEIDEKNKDYYSKDDITIYKEIIYTKIIHPPKLPNKCSLVSNYENLKLNNRQIKRIKQLKSNIYKKGNNLFLTINNLDNYKELKIIAEKINAKIVSE